MANNQLSIFFFFAFFHNEPHLTAVLVNMRKSKSLDSSFCNPGRKFTDICTHTPKKRALVEIRASVASSHVLGTNESENLSESTVQTSALSYA